MKFQPNRSELVANSALTFQISAVGRNNIFFFGDQIQLIWENSTDPWVKEKPQLFVILDQTNPITACIHTYDPGKKHILAHFSEANTEVSYEIHMAQIYQGNGFYLSGHVYKVGISLQGSDEVYGAEEVGP